MNKRTTYETSIAEKLGQLPVPDLRDAIWSRIEDQLNTDLPGGDEEPPLPQPPAKPRSPRSGKSIGVLAVVVTIVGIFIIQQKRSTVPSAPSTKPAIVQPMPTAIIPKVSAPPGRLVDGKAEQQQTNDEPGSDRPASGQSVINKQGDVFPPSLYVVPDTPVRLQIVPPPMANVVQKDTVPQKKPGGVKGITDDDYRISLKKDSVP